MFKLTSYFTFKARAHDMPWHTCLHYGGKILCSTHTHVKNRLLDLTVAYHQEQSIQPLWTAVLADLLNAINIQKNYSRQKNFNNDHFSRIQFRACFRGETKLLPNTLRFSHCSIESFITWRNIQIYWMNGHIQKLWNSCHSIGIALYVCAVWRKIGN